MAIVCLAPENSAFCPAVAAMMKMLLQLLQKFAIMMLVVWTAFDIIYRITLVLLWPAYFLPSVCYNKCLNIFLYTQCQNAEEGTGCQTLLNTGKAYKPGLNA